MRQSEASNREMLFTVKAQNEKQERFMTLFQPVAPRLHRFVLAMTRDRELAKDVVGETVLIAFQRLDTLRHDEAFLSFLFTIATRVARRAQQRAVDAPDVSAVDVERLLDPTTPADVATDIGLLYGALDRLPARQREALLLFEIGGFSASEVREVQGGTNVAVRVRLARARKRLASLLGAEPPEPVATSERATADREQRDHEHPDNADAPMAVVPAELETELGVGR